MKQLYLLLGSVFVFCTSFTQEDPIKWDTAAVIQLGNGYSRVILQSDEDTTNNIYLLNGQLESRSSITNGTQKRYYQNGTLMWSKEIKDGNATGKMKFFDPKGDHIGTLELYNDTIIDTVFLHETKSFVYGRFTYYSKVHGGMRRPDGTSNISQSQGVKSLTPMYAVKHHKTEPAEKYVEFNTDDSGYFFFLAEKGSYGIFPKYHRIENVTSDMGAPIGRHGSGVDTNWNITEPIKISDKFCYLLLHVHSVGYAP